MDFFIASAWADGPAAAQPDMLSAIAPFAILFIVFYFLLIRPQQKRAKEHRQMVAALAKGDEVVTGGGLIGRITELGDNFVEVEVAENVRIRVQRQMLTGVLPKGTLKGDL